VVAVRIHGSPVGNLLQHTGGLEGIRQPLPQGLHGRQLVTRLGTVILDDPGQLLDFPLRGIPLVGQGGHQGFYVEIAEGFVDEGGELLRAGDFYLDTFHF